jgi:hypothetical protein
VREFDLFPLPPRLLQLINRCGIILKISPLLIDPEQLPLRLINNRLRSCDRTNSKENYDQEQE